MIGRRIGSWILEGEVGRGGMGAVFEARHVSLRTRAAVKVLSPGLESEDSFRARFHREADLQVQLRHSNVARVLDYLEDGGQWFLVVEFLDRGSLANLLSRGERISREQAVIWARQALAGLGHAHHKGIVHRDIKPANLMLSESNEIVVVDFGIARAEGAPGLTGTGVSIGTPQYMSPEQIVTPDLVDWRTDVYSLGIVLYELLAGRRPFDSGSQFSVLQAHVSQPPPPLRSIDPAIPAELETVILRALAKKPENRYADCEAMARALERYADAPARHAMGARSSSEPLGGTVRSSVLLEPAVLQEHVGSANDVRNRKKRSFQRQLASGAVATIVAASILAFRFGTAADGEPPQRSTVAAVTSPDTTTTAHTGATTHANATSAAIHPFKPPKPPNTSDRGPSRIEQPPPLPVSPLQGAPSNPPVTATVAPQPPPVVNLPERPRIAVIGMGQDPLLAGALEQTMEGRLDRYDVRDERGDPEVGELLESKGAKVTFKELGTQLVKSGFHILVVLRVEEAESRKIELRDLSGSVKAARMRLSAYLLPVNRSLGSGWTELVEYTEYSVANKAKLAFIGPTADLRKAIDDDWAQLRTASVH